MTSSLYGAGNLENPIADSYNPVSRQNGVNSLTESLKSSDSGSSLDRTADSVFQSSNLSSATDANSYTGDAAAINENLHGLQNLGSIWSGNPPAGVTFNESPTMDTGGFDAGNFARLAVDGVAGTTAWLAFKGKTKYDAEVRHMFTGNADEATREAVENLSKKSLNPGKLHMDTTLRDVGKRAVLEEKVSEGTANRLHKAALRYDDARLAGIEWASGKKAAKEVSEEAAKKSFGQKTVSKGINALHKGSGKALNAVKGDVISRYATKTGVKVITRDASRGVARGIAARVLPRLGLAAVAFPVGAAVSAGLLLLDPQVINFLRHHIFERLGRHLVDENTPPEPPRTYFLPLTHDGNRDPAIENTDKQLVQKNDDAFDFEPDDVWPSEPNIQSTGTFDAYLETFNAITDLVVDAASTTHAAMQKYQEEHYVNQIIEARAPFIEAMTDMPSQLLTSISNESMYPIAGYSNAYSKFRELMLESRRRIMDSFHVDTVAWGLIANPLDIFAANTLTNDDMLNIARELRASADEIDRGNDRLRNVHFNWSYSKDSIRPLFEASSMQQRFEQASDTQRAEEKKTNLPGSTIPTAPGATSPGFSAPTLPSSGIGPSRVPRNNGGSITSPSFDSPRTSTRSEIRAPEMPDITTKPSSITPNVPQFNSDVTTPSFSTPGNLPPTKKLEDIKPNIPDLPGSSIPGSIDSKEIKTDTSSIKPGVKEPTKPDLPTIDKNPKTSDTSKIPDSSSLPTQTKNINPATPPKINTNTTSPASALNPRNLTNEIRGNAPARPQAPSFTPASAPKVVNPLPGNPAGPDNTVKAGLGGGKPEPGAEAGPADPNPEAPEFEEKAASGERENTTVSRDGKNFDLGSGKAAKLAELVNPTDGKPALSVREAMAEAGYDVPDPGANPGKLVSPMDIKPGDLVIGEKMQGVYVGDGMVLTSEGLKPLTEVAVFSGEGQGIFRPDEQAVDADSAKTGQDASAVQDFESENQKSSGAQKSGIGGSGGGPGLTGLGQSGARNALGGGVPGQKASVTPGSDPFDPGGTKANSDPFEKISVTGTGGVKRGFGPNVPLGD